ncbi:MAG TPA: hypothetical protein VES42_07730 [Pilimelia sp.]|nr:hypothetical protein [Pilimelia sp.]
MVSATVQPVGAGYAFTADFYRVTGAFGESVRTEERTFADSDEALDHLVRTTGILVHELST